MLCLKIAQELMKIKTNHLTSTHSFLLSFSNVALQDRTAQCKADNLRCQTCHKENHSSKILNPSCSFRWTSCFHFITELHGHNGDESNSLNRECHYIWQPTVCAGLDIHLGGEKYCRHAILTCILKWLHGTFYWNCSWEDHDVRCLASKKVKVLEICSQKTLTFKQKYQVWATEFMNPADPQVFSISESFFRKEVTEDTSEDTEC